MANAEMVRIHTYNTKEETKMKNEAMNVRNQLPGGGFHGGEQQMSLPGGGFHGGEHIRCHIIFFFKFLTKMTVIKTADFLTNF